MSLSRIRRLSLGLAALALPALLTAGSAAVANASDAVHASTGICTVTLGGVPATAVMPQHINFSFSASGDCVLNSDPFPSVTWRLYKEPGHTLAGSDVTGNILTSSPITFLSMDDTLTGLSAGTYKYWVVGSSILNTVSNNPSFTIGGTPPPPVTKASYSVNRGTKYTGTASGRRVYNIYGQAYLCKTATACNSGGTPIANATLVLQVYRSGAWAYLTTAKTTATGGSATAKVSTSGKVGTLKLRWVVSAGSGYKASPGSTPFFI